MSSLVFHPANYTDKFNSIEKQGKRKKEVFNDETKERLNGFLKLLIAILSVILVLQVIFHLYFAPKLQIKQVFINTGRTFPMDNEALLNAAGLSGKNFYFSTDAADIVRRLEELPVVYSAKAVKQFPDTVTITVQSRSPLAYAFVNIGGFHKIAAFDYQGVVYAIYDQFPQTDLPVISGIQFNEVTEGLLLPETVLPFLQQLHALKEAAPVLYGLISEVKFVKKLNNSFDVLLFLSNYRVKIRISDRINEELMKSIVIVLDLMKREGLMSSLEEVDFRTQEVVYRLREE